MAPRISGKAAKGSPWIGRRKWGGVPWGADPPVMFAPLQKLRFPLKRKLMVLLAIELALDPFILAVEFLAWWSTIGGHCVAVWGMPDESLLPKATFLLLAGQPISEVMVKETILYYRLSTNRLKPLSEMALAINERLAFQPPIGLRILRGLDEQMLKAAIENPTARDFLLDLAGSCLEGDATKYLRFLKKIVD